MGRCSFRIKSQQAVDIHDIKCEAIFLPLVLILTLCMTRSLWFLNPVVKHPYFHTFIFLANWYWLQEIRPLFLFYCGVFKTVPGKCKILCDNGRGGKGGGWQSKGKLRRISVFYDLGSFPQLRSTTTHFPSEEIPQYFQYKKLAKQTDRLYSTEVKNGPCTKNLETYLYFGEKTKAAVDPL